MITPQQIRAARALLDWKQSELAARSGISIAGLAKIEQGQVTPRADTLSCILEAFEEEGLEFTDQGGVQFQSEKFDVRIIKGPTAIQELFEDILQTFRDGKGGELLLSGLDERPWIKHYLEELRETQAARDAIGIQQRLMICEGDRLIGTDINIYRAVPKSVFNQAPYYLYRDKFVLFKVEPPSKVIIIQNESIAEAFRTQFNHNWELGKPLSEGEVERF